MPLSCEHPVCAFQALQSTPVNKRAALEKGGVPVFQPVTPVNAAAVSALQYPQFATAAFPGIQTSYVPVTCKYADGNIRG